MSLRQVSGVVTAEYELEHLLLEGHCFDLSTGQPPRGLQFTLGMSQDPLMHDTIVMANLVSSFIYFKSTASKAARTPLFLHSIFGVPDLISRVFTTTGIFPAESQPRGLDPQVA